MSESTTDQAKMESESTMGQVKTDDLISRQAAIDAVRKLYIKEPKINNDYVYDMAIDEADDAIRELPSAQPERTRGKWEKGVGENGVTTSLFCSECNYENTRWYDWNYCPNCGAKMEGEEE